MLINGGELDGNRILDSETIKQMMENHLPGKADLTDAGDPLYYKGFFDGVGFLPLTHLHFRDPHCDGRGKKS